MRRRGDLITIGKIRQPKDRRSCTPLSIRRQIYISLPNQLEKFEQAVRKAQTTSSKKSMKYVKKRAKMLQFAIKRLDKGLDYIVNVKIPRAARNKSNDYLLALVKRNKTIVATACAFIRYAEAVMVKLSQMLGIEPFKFYESCADKYDSVIRNDPVGYTPENRPSAEFADKWISSRSRFSVLKKLGYHIPNAIRQRQ